VKKSLRLGFCAVVASLALSSPAWAQFLPEIDTGGSLGSNGWTSPATNLTFTASGFNQQGIINSPAAGMCLEYQTFPAGTANPDTRIFVNDHGTQRSVNDDFGGTLQSKARFWFNPSPSSLDWVTSIMPFNSAHNSDNFNFQRSRIDISEAACTTGQTTIAWAKFVGGGSSYTVVLSPNHT
jgi:hypothetical protein